MCKGTRGYGNEMTLRPNNNRTVDESLVPKQLMGTGGERTAGLNSTEGKDPKRTRMRTLGDDIGVYILLTGCAT